MPNHWLLLFIFENSSQSRNGPFVLHLSQAVSQLMLQQGWFISEGFADPFYSFSTWHTQMTPWISSPKNHYRHSVTANILQQYATAVLGFQFTLKKRSLREKENWMSCLSNSTVLLSVIEPTRRRGKDWRLQVWEQDVIAKFRDLKITFFMRVLLENIGATKIYWKDRETTTTTFEKKEKRRNWMCGVSPTPTNQCWSPKYYCKSWVLGTRIAAILLLSWVLLSVIQFLKIKKLCGPGVLPPRFLRVNKALNRLVRSCLGSTRSCPIDATFSTVAMLLGREQHTYDSWTCKLRAMWKLFCLTNIQVLFMLKM